MNSDSIVKIMLDTHGRVRVTPKSSRFPLIYREAMEVSWDPDYNCLVAPPDPNRTPFATPHWWFAQILSAVREQGCYLLVVTETQFENVPDTLRADFQAALEKSTHTEHAALTSPAATMESYNTFTATLAYTEGKHLFHEGNFEEFVRRISEHEQFLTATQKHFLSIAKKKLKS